MKCRICKTKIEKIYSCIGVRSHLDIPVYCCNDCKAYFTFPPKVDYSAPSNSIIDYYSKSRLAIEARHESIIKHLELNFPHSKRKFLDVGCGIGYSLSVAKNLGYYAVGIEPSNSLAQYAKKHININVIEGFFSEKLICEDNKLNSNLFDYILIDNVLEHVDNPIIFLRLAQKLLTKNGILIIAVPPVDWFRRLLIKFSYIRGNIKSSRINLFYDVEQHINYFSRHSIKALIKESNVDLELIYPEVKYHHSPILNGRLARLLNFETGYYFISKAK